MSKHVLALEAANEKGWLGRQPLVQALDSYLASNKFAADNVKEQRVAVPRFQMRPNGGGVSTSSGNGRNSQNNNLTRSQVKSSFTAQTQRRCFTCDSPNHMQMNCPHKVRNTGFGNRGQTRQTAQVNACVDRAVQQSTLPRQSCVPADCKQTLSLIHI